MSIKLEEIQEINPFTTFQEGRIVSKVQFEGVEQDHKGNIVYVRNFDTTPQTKLIAYTGDEVVGMDREYEIIINRLTQKTRGYKEFLLALGEVYHEFRGGEQLDVVVSGISNRGQPMFRLWNYLGFILPSGRIKLGNQVRIRVKKVKPAKKGQIIEASPLEEYLDSH